MTKRYTVLRPWECRVIFWHYKRTHGSYDAQTWERKSLHFKLVELDLQTRWCIVPFLLHALCDAHERVYDQMCQILHSGHVSLWNLSSTHKVNCQGSKLLKVTCLNGLDNEHRNLEGDTESRNERSCIWQAEDIGRDIHVLGGTVAERVERCVLAWSQDGEIWAQEGFAVSSTRKTPHAMYPASDKCAMPSCSVEPNCLSDLG